MHETELFQTNKFCGEEPAWTTLFDIDVFLRTLENELV